MNESMGIQAILAWNFIFGESSVLEEPETPYGDPDQQDLLSARELFDLPQKVQEKLRHPEGIRIKDKDAYREELLDIYAHIFPNLDEDIRQARIDRLIAPGQNAFSENLSHLNKALGTLFGQSASPYQVYGANGQPRRILLDPVFVA